MRDFYNDGYEDGRGHYGEHEYPESQSDKASYERGREYGELRRKIGEELDRGDE